MLVSLLPILAALLLGAMSPGPSFVLVTRTAVTQSRRNGLAAAIGMGVGGLFFGTLALLGLTALLAQVAWLNMALRLAGGLYLLYLAFRIWRGAGAPLTMMAGAAADEPASSLGRAFAVALATQLSNPKTAVAYASIFAALLPASAPSAQLLLVLPPLIFLIEAGWYTVVALAFSLEGPRRAYIKAKRGIDQVTGAVMGALGLRLMVDALRDVGLAR
ncbi:MAG: LysE family transporter [Azospirillaceae bacterium]|nr:LysE family transporter [Azospirillaceae bacterium]